ncbi:MAG: hydrogenase formation protein HypD [Gemmataceae bacterium]
MRFLDEYRNPDLARSLLRSIQRLVSRPWVIMEVCGGQTHSLIRHGIDQLLPEAVHLIHGPGCPVCVTPLEMIDRALAIAQRPNVIFCTFGDMLRVPGSRTDLQQVRASGADVRIVYSPLETLKIAREHPHREVVFFAVGFETTAPVTALAARQARRLSLTNFSLLVSHVLVPPALEAILSDPASQVQGFLAAGHVCTISGFLDYERIQQQYQVPLVVTGFEPVDLLEGIWMLLTQLETGRTAVENQYARTVRREGNRAAQECIEEVYEICDRSWRGVGRIPASGLRLRQTYYDLDAEHRFDVGQLVVSEPAECRSGEVLRGLLRPPACAAFATQCTPEHPLGAPMVSSEGACAAYYRRARSEVGT